MSCQQQCGHGNDDAGCLQWALITLYSEFPSAVPAAQHSSVLWGQWLVEQAAHFQPMTQTEPDT